MYTDTLIQCYLAVFKQCDGSVLKNTQDEIEDALGLSCVECE